MSARLRSLSVLLAASLALSAVAAAPANAAKRPKAPSYVAAANGVVGVSQAIQVSAPRYANRTVGISLTGAGSTTPLSVALDAKGNGSVNWTPPSSGSWSIQGTGPFAVATGSAIFVSAIPTATTVFAPNVIQASTPSPNLNNVPSSLAATVSVPSGTYTPTGSVQFSYLNGSTIGSAPLVATSPGVATANLNFTTPEIGYYNIVATYFPTLGAGGFSNAGVSSDMTQMQTVQVGPAMSMRLPSKFRIGTPTTVTALIANGSLTGSAAFEVSVNGAVSSISPSVPASNGGTTVPWTPATLGNQVVSSTFSANNSFVSASTQQAITALPRLTPDPISAAPSGQGAWPVGANIPLPAGARIAVAATAQSGSPLNMSSTGNCVVIGSTLIATASSGVCTLTVTSPGSSAWGPNSAAYNFSITSTAKK